MTSEMKPIRWLLALAALFFVGQAFAHGMSEAEKQSILAGGNLSYLKLGATHMLSGYDHLLFVFGIVFFLTNFKDIVKYITAFTIGHSVTLIWATFNGVKVNYFLIDAVIGLSVCYIAFVNLDGFKRYLQLRSPNLLLMIGALGLIHGLGLSTRLQQLPLNKDALLMNIISFNVGVELGQVLALAAMLILLSSWRKLPSFKPFSVFSNFALMFGGVLLFLMQMHGYSHVSTPDEFGFSSDNHVHDHIKLDEERAAAIRNESKRTTID
jgi:HupE / UreJ protein